MTTQTLVSAERIAEALMYHPVPFALGQSADSDDVPVAFSDPDARLAYRVGRALRNITHLRD